MNSLEQVISPGWSIKVEECTTNKKARSETSTSKKIQDTFLATVHILVIRVVVIVRMRRCAVIIVSSALIAFTSSQFCFLFQRSNLMFMRTICAWVSCHFVYCRLVSAHALQDFEIGLFNRLCIVMSYRSPRLPERSISCVMDRCSNKSNLDAPSVPNITNDGHSNRRFHVCYSLLLDLFWWIFQKTAKALAWFSGGLH